MTVKKLKKHLACMPKDLEVMFSISNQHIREINDHLLPDYDFSMLEIHRVDIIIIPSKHLGIVMLICDRMENEGQ